MKPEEKDIEKYSHKELNSPHGFITEKEDHLEIDLKEIFYFIKGNLKKVYITTSVFLMLGIFVAIFTPEEYTASTILLPESGGTGAQTANNLVQNFGLGNMFQNNAQTGGMGVAIYPQIVKSTPFLMNLIDEEIYFVELDSSVSVYNYFINVKPGFLEKVKSYTIGLPGRLIRWISGPNKNANLPVAIPVEKDSIANEDHDVVKIRQLTRGELNVIKNIAGRISISVATTITVGSRMPDPMAAAQVTDLTVKYLTAYVKDYKIGKLQEDLEFIEERFTDAENKFIEAQNKLAGFRDRNLNITTASARSEEERLKAEYDLAFGIYRSLGQQLEQTRIKIQEETPVFQLLEPVQVPIEKSAPDELKIIIMFVFFGAFIGFAWIVGIFVWNWVKNNILIQ